MFVCTRVCLFYSFLFIYACYYSLIARVLCLAHAVRLSVLGIFLLFTYGVFPFLSSFCVGRTVCLRACTSHLVGQAFTEVLDDIT